jgi:hypothetical protein
MPLEKSLTRLDRSIGGPTLPTCREMMAARRRFLDRTRDWLRAAFAAAQREDALPARVATANDAEDAALVASWDAANGVSAHGAREELRRRLEGTATNRGARGE